MKYGKISSLLGSGILALANLYPLNSYAMQTNPTVSEAYVSTESGTPADNDQRDPYQRQRGEKKPRNFIKRMKQKYQTYKHHRQEAKYSTGEFRTYLKRNALRFPGTWTAANEIASYASKMIEKHYDGVNSIVAGARCLAELGHHVADPDALRETRNKCHDQLQAFKRYKRQKHLSAEQFAIAQREIQHIFPVHPELVAVLTSALTSDMECTLRGGSVSGAWFLGASVGGYQLKCTTPLGRRELYAKLNTAGTLGWGGDVSLLPPTYIMDQDGRVRERTFRLPLAMGGLRPSLLLRSGVALGVSANAHTNIPLTNHSHDDQLGQRIETGAGLGLNVGAGFGNLVKIDDMTSDFRGLFEVMELPFH